MLATMANEPRFSVGVDLGQRVDFTAVCVLERSAWTICREKGPREGRPERPAGPNDKDVRWLLTVRVLERTQDDWEKQREFIRYIVEAPELQTEVVPRAQPDSPFAGPTLPKRTVPPWAVIDATGVGDPIVRELNLEGLETENVQLHAGRAVNYKGGYTNLPKRDLVAMMQLAVDLGWMYAAEDLELGQILVDELRNFHFEINNRTLNDSYASWRENQHDDLVLAAGMACWGAIRPRKQFMSGTFSGDDGVLRGGY